jgi:hypothetical protein
MGPIETIFHAIHKMPENSASEVRIKDKAFDAAMELLIRHLKMLLPHGCASCASDAGFAAVSNTTESSAGEEESDCGGDDYEVADEIADMREKVNAIFPLPRTVFLLVSSTMRMRGISGRGGPAAASWIAGCPIEGGRVFLGFLRPNGGGGSCWRRRRRRPGPGVFVRNWGDEPSC